MAQSCWDRVCWCHSSDDRATAAAKHRPLPPPSDSLSYDDEFATIGGPGIEMGGFRVTVTDRGDKAFPQKGTFPSRHPKNHVFKGKALTLADIRQTQQVNKRGGFSDHYVLGDRLARGGFGTTYKATERKTNREVVVKVPDDITDTSDFTQLMEKSHPHIVRVFACFQDTTGVHIVMEYCAGGDLFHAFWLLAQQEGGVSTNWCAHVFRHVCDGTLYLHHTFGQAHNDIKPENILLERPPTSSSDPVRAMLADFGLVCAYHGEAEGGADAPAAGDPRYAAPELMNLATNSSPNSASDCWSLGVTLYELLVGKLPFIHAKNIRGWCHFAEYQDGKLLMRLLKKYDDMFNGKIDGLSRKDAAKVQNMQGRQLLVHMLQVDEKNRFDLISVRNHVFLKLADDLYGERTGKVHLPYDVCRAHAARGVFKLREALLEIVESKVTGVPDYDEELWQSADTDHDGVLSLEEFTVVWDTVVYPPGERKPLAKKVFDLIDLDVDGSIAFDEFMTFQFDPRKLDPETREQCFRSAFISIAGPHSDAITQDDLRKAFAADSSSVDNLFDELDYNQDGLVFYDEFSAYLMHLTDDVDPESFCSAMAQMCADNYLVRASSSRTTVKKNLTDAVAPRSTSPRAPLLLPQRT